MKLVTSKRKIRLRNLDDYFLLISIKIFFFVCVYKILLCTISFAIVPDLPGQHANSHIYMQTCKVSHLHAKSHELMQVI